MKKKILIGVAAALLLIQFIRIDRSVPATDASLDLVAMTKPDAEVEKLLRIACYDCHSYETAYPWYSQVAPVSWWVKKHINGGREELNFSTWGNYDEGKRSHKAEESAEEVVEKHMPLTPYWMAHWEAKLTEEQRKSLGDWFNSLK